MTHENKKLFPCEDRRRQSGDQFPGARGSFPNRRQFKQAPHNAPPKPTKGRDSAKFETYWDEAAVTAGLDSGQLLLGQLRINPKNYTEGYTRHFKGDADIFIPGTRARNRALNGDIVVIRLEPVRNWRVYDAFLPPKATESEVSELPVQKAGNSNSNGNNAKDKFVTVGDLLRQNPAHFRELFRNVRGNLLEDLDDVRDPENLPSTSQGTLCAAARLPWWQLIQRIGRVVSIHRRLNCRACVGFLRPMSTQKNSEGEKGQASDHSAVAVPKSQQQQACDWSLAILSPTDSRVPRIIIPKSKCPPDFVRQPESFKLVRFVARITDWPEDSIFAKGELLRSFADSTMGCIEAETDRILVSTGFPYGLKSVNTFSESVESYVKQCLKELEKHQEEELLRRRDFRDQCVFTIDPRTARDLDDALHIRILEPDEIEALEAKGVRGAMYEVGVHIADVTHYVRPDTPLDAEAAARATTVYLVQLCVPMLPRSLCEDLCSLHPGSPKLAFSVVFVLTKDAEILTKWFGRTVIRSRAKLSYEDAQGFLDEPDRDWKNDDFPGMEESTSALEICRSVVLLNELAEKIRSRRFSNGSVQLNQVKPVFSLSPDSGLPIGVAPFILKQANRLIEEWMLTANEAVATLLAQRLPNTAFLRRHPPPTTKQIKEAQSVLSSVGVDVQVGTAGDLQRSLSLLSGNPLDVGWQHSDELAELCASMLGSVRISEVPSAAEGNCVKPDSSSLSEEARMLTTLNILTRCMNLAEYFCLGAVDDDDCQSHYALNMDNYTHFTSPIRRYADVIVHRQLALILAENAEQANHPEIATAYRSTCTSDVLQNVKELSSIAEYCNARKQDARRAGEESAELFFTILVKECGPIQEACSVVGVLSHSFDVLLLSSGLVKRIYLNKLDLKSFEYEAAAEESTKNIAGTGTLHMIWNVRSCKDDKGEAKGKQTGDGDQGVPEVVPPQVASNAASTSDDGLPNDPAICRSRKVDKKQPKLGTFVGRDAGRLNSSAQLPAPCDCFVSHIRLFDICRCEVSVEANGTEDSNTQSVEEGGVSSSNQLPKLLVTMLRPTCSLCEFYR
nr:unnamed protein product [Spirometra erinaceieuropaei]